MLPDTFSIRTEHSHGQDMTAALQITPTQLRQSAERYRLQAAATISAEQAKILIGTAEQLEMSADELEQMQEQVH